MIINPACESSFLSASLFSW